MNQVNWQAYDITRGENIQQGYFAALEVILRRYTSTLESYFFEVFKIHCQFSTTIQSNLQLRDYLDKIEQPSPIFIFGFSPLRTDSLLVMENRLANLFLNKDALFSQGKAVIPKRFTVNNDNYHFLEETTTDLLNSLSESWGKLQPASSTLKNLVSHRVKAKVLTSTESVVVVKIKLQYHGFTTGFEFCFSAYELDPILKKYGKKALLSGYCEKDPSEDEKKHLSEAIQKRANYQVKGYLGEMVLSKTALLEAKEKNLVLPISNILKDNLLVTLNGEPVFNAVSGESRENSALQVIGPYLKGKEEAKKTPPPFTPSKFPSA
ncbi:MAG: hypothetical protein QNL04_02455 [SAR324 cluster bacterium]|nr:hypothetical protein [SAR324 cluster bacterium]